MSLVLRSWILSHALVLVAWSSSGFSQVLPDMNTSVRALGMGNAYTSVVDDTDSLFYNPAGLANTGGFHWKIFDLKLNAADLESYTKFTDLQSGDGFADTISDLYGESIFFAAGLNSAIVTPVGSLAKYYVADVNIAINNPAVPEMDVHAIYDEGFAIGSGFNILPGFQMGMVIKKIKRMGSRKTYGTRELGSLNPDTLEEEVVLEGTGYSADLGVNIAPGVGVIQPVLTFVWRDMGDTKFRPLVEGQEAPPTDPSNMIIGFSTSFNAGLARLTPVFEYQYLNRSDIQIGKKVNLGLEIDLPLIDVRGGFHQGYYTLGVGLNLGLIRLDLATWGVEAGAYPGQIEDRRYALSFSLELGFDANLNFVGAGGASSSGEGGGSARQRGLKRRR